MDCIQRRLMALWREGQRAIVNNFLIANKYSAMVLLIAVDRGKCILNMLGNAYFVTFKKEAKPPMVPTNATFLQDTYISVPWFGEFCSCCCLPLLPQLACSILVTWGSPYTGAQQRINYNLTENPSHILERARCRKRRKEKQIFRFPPLSKRKVVDTVGRAAARGLRGDGGGRNQKNCGLLSTVTSCDSQ